MAGDESFRWFREDRCDRCGECLSHCNVLRLPQAAAMRDMEALIEGRLEDSLAFAQCLTCNACDLVCPRGADPYELILQRFGEYQKKHGLPAIAKMVVPSEPENLWAGLRVLMDEEENALVRGWEESLGRQHREILLTGFYANIVPFLARAAILDELRPHTAGSVMLWGCGGDTNKLGNAEQTARTVDLIARQFHAMGVERVICFMEAEAAMLGEVLPRRFGASFPFEVVSLDEWLLDRLQSGKIAPARALDLTVTVHDNCMSRYFNGRPQDVVREIARRCGCRLVEMEHNRRNALCCGWAATIPTLYGGKSDNPLRTLLHLLLHLDRRLQEARDSGADAIVAGCPACYLFLALIAELEDAKIAVVHPIELIQSAVGVRPERKIPRRCFDLLAITANLLLRWAFSKENRRRFSMRPLDPTTLEPLPSLSPKDAERVAFLARILHGRLVQNRIARKVLASGVKSAIAVYRRTMRTYRWK